MSGPGLKKVDSHAAIHEAALNEARELTDLMAKLIHQRQMDKALETAYITVEQWESRTLAHADSEEAGLYQEISSESSEDKENVTRLTRDHDLLRRLVREIKQALADEVINHNVLQKFYALIHVDTIHNEDEEEWVHQRTQDDHE